MALNNPYKGNQADFQRALAYTLRSDHLGNWGSDHNQEAKAFQGFNYMAIAAIGRLAAKAVGYVYDNSKPGLSTLRKGLQGRYGSIWRSFADQGVAQTVSDEHWVSQLVNNPNTSQSKQLFQWEFIQQMHLHGCCLIFNRENQQGDRVVARYIVPMAMTQPVYVGQYSDYPNGGVRIMPTNAGLGYFIHPVVRQLTGAIIPAEYLSVIRYPDPAMRGDGKSPTDAAGWWIDTSLMVDQARWKQLKRGPRPHGVVTVKGENGTPTDDELDAIERRLNQKLGDGEYDQRVLAVGDGTQVPTEATPTDMDYVNSWDQVGAAILSLHGANKAAVGLTDSQTYGSVAASQDQCVGSAQSDLDLLAGDYTILARDYGENVEVQYEVPPHRDPQLIETQLQTDIQGGYRTVGELRALRGLPPFGDWRDNARVTASGLVFDTEPPKAASQAPAEQPAFDTGLPKSFAKSYSKPGYGFQVGSEQVPIIAIDLDGTLAEEVQPYDPAYIGNPIEERVADVRRLKDAGCQICIFTCRDDDDLVASWLDAYGIPWDAINANPEGFEGSGKVFAHVYWDNRAVHTDEPFRELVKRLPEGIAKQILLQQTKGEQKLGCIMLELPESVVSYCKSEHETIIRDCPYDLRDDGLEGEPHITLLYGIVGCSLSEVVEQVKRLDAFEVSFGPISTFDRPDGVSVCKYEVASSAIHNANAVMKGSLPYVETFPDYQPHMTLAYLSSGSSYVQDLPKPGPLTDKHCYVTSAVISMDGQKVRVPLRSTPESKQWQDEQVVLEPDALAGQPRIASYGEIMTYAPKAQVMTTFDSGLPMKMNGHGKPKSLVARRIFEDAKQSALAIEEASVDQRLSEFESKIEAKLETLAKSLPSAEQMAELWSDRLAKLLERRDPEQIEGKPPVAKIRPVAAGMAVVAEDTGRVLLLQRALTEDSLAAGKWECPGGWLEEGEDPFDAAYREYQEETGLKLPEGAKGPVASWDCGKYVGYVMTVPVEADIPINVEREVMNPDPDGDQVETLAWWTLPDMQDSQAIRQELRDTLDIFREAVSVVEPTGSLELHPVESDASEQAEETAGDIEA